MRYLCLIYLDEKQLGAMPEPEVSALNARHLAFNDALLDSGDRWSRSAFHNRWPPNGKTSNLFLGPVRMPALTRKRNSIC